MASLWKNDSKKFVAGGTKSTRKHRFESFNQRIAKLNIDPIRRSRHIDVEATDLTSTTSYLQTGLEQWKESNLSEDFTNFVRELTPLCDNLPQILHYQQNILAILVKYISKQNSLSLEPLLDLLARFAHDLGVRFETHFSTAVTLVASVASSHTDVEVIEWSFTCLAWLFKYLSRLLVPDLRPLFQIMAPLLGREPQKIHTTRFAAEAMSFLLRKAAIVFPKNHKPLCNIIHCIIDDLESVEQKVKNPPVYYHGLMTLLLNSIKGIARKLNSCGHHIYQLLLERISERDSLNSEIAEYILFGLTVGLIHDTDAESFSPVIHVIFQNLQKQESKSRNRFVAMHGQLLFIVATVRRGSRVDDWSLIFDVLMLLFKLCRDNHDEDILEVFKAAAAIFQSSPLDIAIPRLRPAMDFIGAEKNAEHSLKFCGYFWDLGRERFEDLVFPYFSRWVNSEFSGA